MHTTLARMKQAAFRRLNSHAYTFDDVTRICGKENITLKLDTHDSDILGYITRTRDPKPRHTIVINSTLDEIGRTFVGLHELAHYFVHVPVSAKQYFYCRRLAERTRSKHDCEADSFALIAMIPQGLLFELARTYWDDLPLELVDVCRRRWQLYIDHGI